MRILLRRPTIAILAATPITAVSLFGAGISLGRSAELRQRTILGSDYHTCRRRGRRKTVRR